MNHLTKEQKAEMKFAMEQTDAIWALEGFETTEQRRQICAAILEGKVTQQQVIDEMLIYVKEHKTTRGFIESRTWK